MNQEPIYLINRPCLWFAKGSKITDKKLKEYYTEKAVKSLVKDGFVTKINQFVMLGHSDRVLELYRAHLTAWNDYFSSVPGTPESKTKYVKAQRAFEEFLNERRK